MFSPSTVSLSALAFASVYWLAKRALWRRIISTTTILDDLPHLGTVAGADKKNGTVIIAGGSIAGLLTARVCSDHFSNVVVIDPEDYIHGPDATQPWSSSAVRAVAIDGGSYNTLVHERSRVYQFTALHIYYAIVLRVLRKLFPATINAEARRFSVLIRPFGFNCRLSGWGFRQPFAEYARRGEAYPDTLYASRRAIEGMVRALVKMTCQTVEWIHGTATELKLAADGRIRAVTYRLADGTIEETECAMFIDCTGNTQAGLKLLERALPLDAAKHIADIRKSYDPKVFYATHEFPKPPGFDHALKDIEVDYGIVGPANGHPQRVDTDMNAWFLSYLPNPAMDNRTVILGRREGGNPLVVVGGSESELPMTLDEIMNYARGVSPSVAPVPNFFFKVLELLRPVEAQRTTFVARTRSCSKISYEQLPSHVLPCNFIAVGDSTMRLNPVFGEGVSKCAVGAATLDGLLRTLAGGPTNPSFARAYFTRLDNRTQHLWDSSRFSDYGRPTTVPAAGETLHDGAFMRWYQSHLYPIMARNDAAASAFWHSLNFLGPPLALMSPGIMLRVIWEAIWPSNHRYHALNRPGAAGEQR